MDPLAKESATDETLGDENQLGNTIFSKSPEDNAYLKRNLENNNYSGDTILLGFPKRKNHNEEELEGESPSGDTVPIETLPDETIPLEHEPEENAVAPLLVGSPKINKPYKDTLK